VARVVARLDREERLAFLSMDAPESDPWLAPLPEDERRATWHLVFPDGRYLDRGEGAVALFELLPRLSPLGRTARRLKVVGFIDVLYELVARNRSRLGKLVPNVPPPRRFP
jgi:predicted DCC family thiol-disulfide oxidoreductase YuxK